MSCRKKRSKLHTVFDFTDMKLTEYVDRKYSSMYMYFTLRLRNIDTQVAMYHCIHAMYYFVLHLSFR